ncbi:MAG: maleylpyruvate isomerase family mycothiol-dependent enzyme [Acidimicrobiales bacterium]|nr:maleylpyruvate isomerase family mycothiol-dependent enzyme [Acidimicrobiales bacterium]
MATWELAGRARYDFCDMIDTLTPEQLEQQSLCAQWTAHGVTAHLAGFVETGAFSFFGGLLKTGFNFDKASVAMVNSRIDRPTADLCASLRANATKSAPMPMFPEAMTVSDVAIHTQDVRRPLGAAGSLDDEVLNTALEFVTTHKLGTTLVDRRPIEGIKLVATDRDWTFGEGAEITGTGEALLMGLANRPVLDDLSGEGLSGWS